MKFTMKKFLVGAVAAAGMAVASTAAHAQANWSMATPWGGGKPFEDAKAFAAMVKSLTEGRVNITVFPAGTLGKALKVTDSVKSGVAQAGHNWMGYDWGIDKTTVIFGGYVGGLTEEEFFLWLFKAGGVDMWKKYRMENFGVVSIPCGIFPAEIFLHSKRKVTNLAEYKGLKQRTAGAWAEVGGSLGATTVILPGAGSLCRSGAWRDRCHRVEFTVCQRAGRFPQDRQVHHLPRRSPARCDSGVRVQ